MRENGHVPFFLYKFVSEFVSRKVIMNDDL